MNARQLDLYQTSSTDEPAAPSNTESTFADNLALPVHRWFRYSAGFSAAWVRQLLRKEKANGRKTVFDPFAGSGTTVLEAEAAEMAGLGIEAHPFVARIARAKLNWRLAPSDLRASGASMLESAVGKRGGAEIRKAVEEAPKLLSKCFPPDALVRLYALQRAWDQSDASAPVRELTWLALVSILRECSPVGTAQWQYVLPNKTKARAVDPFSAFSKKIELFADDMQRRQSCSLGPRAEIRRDDARTCESIPADWADLVITSPPYANNYDYADATRLEMTFAGQINGWSDLQSAVRQYLVRSCSQHVSSISGQTQEILATSLLNPIRAEITDVCNRLLEERERHGGKKTYHTMVAAYFSDMASTWVSLRRVTREGGLVCFVIGDSAPYGIYVPVDKWLGALAIAAGFRSFRFEKTRDRNIKWKNRKHRVPLHEGRLWVDG